MIEYQRIILADKLRNESFRSALKKVIRPGKTVVADLGSGTGFLAFLARMLGAKECHLYDASELLELSRAIAQGSGITGCTFHQTHSTLVERPAKADVVVSETLGNFALEEGIIETLNDARRFLKPSGTVIPASLTQWVAPVISPRLWKEITSWDRVGAGIDFSLAREISCNNIYVRSIRPAEMPKGSAQKWDTLDFRKQNDPLRSATLNWKGIGKTVYGFALWWEVSLVPGITLSTASSAPRTHWEQIYMPVLEPIRLKKGESLELRLSVDSRQEVRINVAWDIRAIASDGSVREHQRLDMQRGRIG